MPCQQPSSQPLDGGLEVETVTVAMSPCVKRSARCNSSLATRRAHGHRRRRWFRRMTGLERMLLAFCVTLLLSWLVILVILVTGLGHRTSHLAPEICYTVECIHAASSIISKMNPNSDPCQDFYSFACGSFVERNVAPDDGPYRSTLQQIQEDVFVIVKKLIEKPIADEDRDAIVKVKMLYNSCLNDSWSEGDEGIGVLMSLLSTGGQGLGTWPVLDGSWSDSDLNLEKTLAVLLTYHVHPLVDSYVSTDDKNSSVYMLQFYRGAPALEKDFYLNDTHPLYVKYMARYHRLMVETARILGAPNDIATSDMKDVIDFEKQLANMTHTKWHKDDGTSNDTDDGYNKMTIADMQQLIPEIKWVDMMEYVFSTLDFSINASNLSIILRSKDYYQDLVTFLTLTPKRVVSNYLIWRFILEYMPHVNRRFNQLYLDFMKEVPDLHESRTYFSRWKECTSIVNNGFGMALGSMYVKNNFLQDMQSEIADFIQRLKSAFLEIIESQQWLDDETREDCKQKLQVMGRKIGFPRYILEDDALDNYYQGLEIDESHLLHNILKVKRFEVRKELKKLHRLVNREKDWWGSPLDVNAFYRPNFNEIVFPVGILRDPIYNSGHPSYLKFGSIGVVIGHELAHGLDNYGRKYDKNGNLTQWWSDEMIERFNKKAACFAEQYSVYEMEEINENVNGNDTLGDNICDNAGLKQAYVAYQKWKSVHGDEPMLPGITYTSDQMFFIQYGQVWCEAVSREGYIKYTRDPHSPGKYRTIGVVSNSPEFSTTFNCPLGSPMNPVKKCHLWT